MKLWKRNAVVSAIVLFVCAAVYLNWSYAQAEVGEYAAGGGKTLGQAALVSGPDGQEKIVLGQPQAEGQAPAQAQTAGETAAEEGDYFSSARVTRQQARDSALTILQETAGDQRVDQSTRDMAAASIAVMASSAMTEAQIESLIAAKGYRDCVTFIGDNSISVVVSAVEGGLTSTDAAKITDIVMGETQFTAGQIKIIEAD